VCVRWLRRAALLTLAMLHAANARPALAQDITPTTDRGC